MVKLHESWLAPLQAEFDSSYMADLRQFLVAEKAAGKRIFPPGGEWFHALDATPLDRVKIDRSFVAGIETGDTPLALLHGITDLCHGLGLKITVEGVETASQLAIVRGSGKIDKVQGYLFGPALPATAIAEMATRMPAENAAADAPAAVAQPGTAATG